MNAKLIICKYYTQKEKENVFKCLHYAVLITLESLKRKKQSEEIQNIVDETKVDEVL